LEGATTATRAWVAAGFLVLASLTLPHGAVVQAEADADAAYRERRLAAITANRPARAHD
jgi:hypothetical protein